MGDELQPSSVHRVVTKDRVGLRPIKRFRADAAVVYEVERRRIPVSALPVMARTLSLSLSELFGEDKLASRTKRGPALQWQMRPRNLPGAAPMQQAPGRRCGLLLGMLFQCESFDAPDASRSWATAIFSR